MQLKTNRDGLTLALAEKFAAACTATDIRKAKRDAIRHVKNDTWQEVQ